MLYRCVGLCERSAHDAKWPFLEQTRNRETLRWWRVKPGTLDAEPVMSQDLCQPVSCRVVPSQGVSHCVSSFPVLVMSCARTKVAFPCKRAA